jgi:hypothetical protein
MEIGPVAGIRVLPVAKVPPVERGLSAVFDIEATAREVDDAWSGEGGKSSGGQDDATDDIFAEDDVEPGEAPRRVNIIA